MTPAIRALVASVATAHALDVGLVQALVQVESGGQPWAWRPEPGYRWLWDVQRGGPFKAQAHEFDAAHAPKDFPAPPGVSADAEWWGQRASWGLMQVMGAVAREQGFDGRFLSALCDPETGLTIGCRVLVARLRAVGGDVDAALAQYNGGPAGNQPGRPLRNAAYVSKVRAVWA